MAAVLPLLPSKVKGDQQPSSQPLNSSPVRFLLNGKEFEVPDPDPTESLLSFLRRSQGAGLKGTKGLCYQGGCGACTVLLSSPAPLILPPPPPSRAPHPVLPGQSSSEEVPEAPEPGSNNARGALGVAHRAVNSCLVPLCAVDGLAVTTVEGVGSTTRGLHPVQQQMHEHNASQCGFCTSGMVMSLYSQLKHKGGALTPELAETLADGNICRCTGYRPILDAYQALACGGGCERKKSDGSAAPACAPEIEDLCGSSGRCVKASLAEGREAAAAGRGRVTASSGEHGAGSSTWACRAVEWRDAAGTTTWQTVPTLEALFAALHVGGRSVRLVCGNTGSGVYPPQQASLLLDVSRIPELRTLKVSPAGITLGAAVTLSDLMEALEANRDASSLYPVLLRHLKRVAGHQVRNVGSVVGNLMLTRRHPDFPSDMATIMTGCGASLAVAVCGPAGSDVTHVPALNFIRKEQLPAGLEDDENVVVLSVHIPAIRTPSQTFLSFKVAQRAVNAHAFANAAFLFSRDPATGVILEAPVLVFGGLQPLPTRAPKTEQFLAGKDASDSAVIQQALALLSSELPPHPSFRKPAYRASLARSFLYKGLLSLLPAGKLPADLVSAVTPYERPLSSGQVSFDQGDPSVYPVTKPIPKLSAAIQTTGEAQYLDDLDHVGEVHARYVLASVANAALASLDPSAALQMQGVLAFLSAESLAADGFCNSIADGEELLASKRVVYHGQPVGIVVAASAELAEKAAKLVDVRYTDVQPPILTLDDAVAADSFFPDKKRELKAGDFEAALAAADMVVTGTNAAHHQYHFTTETQRAICLPGEDGQLVVYSSTQNPSLIQSLVSTGTGVPQHKVKVVVKRVGGAYGSKLNRCAPVAMACAIACRKVSRPVRLILPLDANMKIVGGRSPYRYTYTVAVRKDGVVSGIKMRVLNNHGAHYDFEYPEMGAFLAFIDNTYNIQTWDVEVQVAKTNLPASTWIRAPGNVESLFVTETMMEHVACALGLSPEAVRERNLYKAGDVTVWGDKLTYCTARQVVDTLKASCSFDERVKAVSSFNASSRWVKRGISLVPVKYVLSWTDQCFNAFVNIYPDATVSVAHGGCELGQGLNVKVAQTASYALGQLTSDGCPMSLISVKDTTTDVANNVAGTGGSIGSELCSMATKGACDILAQRLRPVATQLRRQNGEKLPTWAELIGAAVAHVDMQARFRVHPGESGHGPNQYCSFGAGVSEAEVDLLTGEYRILRSDLLLDCGKSLNPAVDIGQMQGAFVMGLGYMLMEELEYESSTGKLLSDSTWEYKPPSYADIPIDFRCSLLPNSPNPYGFLRSKASGEPPLAMSCSALFAVRHALVAGRVEVAAQVCKALNVGGFKAAQEQKAVCVGGSTATSPGAPGVHHAPEQDWVALPAPATVERVCLTANIPVHLLTL